MSRTVVITGAGRGIGLELARLYAQAGDRVIGGVRNPSAAPALDALAGDWPLRIEALDVVSQESVESFRRSLDGVQVDILINNAGVLGGDRQSLTDMDYDVWREAFEVNTIAPFRLATALLPNLERSPCPKIVTLTSQMGSLNRRGVGSYAYRSSKAAANKIMQVMAVELERRNIVVCPMHPGWVRTDMGGSQADISVEESARGIFEVVDGLDLSKSGRFWNWDGSEHPW